MTNATPTQEQKITRDMTIGSIVEQYPSVVDLLLAQGVQCVGCGAAHWESLEDGLRGHAAMTEEAIDDLIRRMNESIPEEINQGGELVITTTAVEKLKEIMQRQNKEGMGLRVLVKRGGCSGHTYGFEFAKGANSDDKTIEIAGAKFFIDHDSFGLLRGAKIDYLDTLQGAGFTITNPNAKSTCGCGKSFK